MSRPFNHLMACLAMAGSVLFGPQPARAQSAGGLDWTQLLDRVPWQAFAPADHNRDFALPGDHGPHRRSPADAWNLLAHLETEDGEAVGLQVSLARLALVPPEANTDTLPGAEWEMRELWRGHAVVVKSGAGGAMGVERLRRDFHGIAGWDAERRELRIDDWSIRFTDGNAPVVQVAVSVGSEASVALDFVSRKAAVMPRPGDTTPPFTGYALTRLEGQGTLATPGASQAVSGVAWFEHLWGDLPFPGGPTATDRLVLHFDDETELSITRTRRRDGSGTPTADGFVVGRNGRVEQIAETTTLSPAETWRASSGGPEYPIRWLLSREDGDLRIEPVVDDQLQHFVLPVWSGLVVARSASGTDKATAVGTLQLQGYER